MRTTTTAVLILAASAVALGNAEAKRLGDGKTTGIAKTEASAPKAAPTAAPAPKPPTDTKKIVAAAAVGAAAGVVTGAVLAGAPASAAQPAAAPPPSAPPPSVSPGIAASEARLRRLDEEAARDKNEKAPPVKSAAERRREQKEAAEKAAQERKAEAQRAQLAREMSCQIKPVMTDAEIANCRNVWR